MLHKTLFTPCHPSKENSSPLPEAGIRTGSKARARPQEGGKREFSFSIHTTPHVSSGFPKKDGKGVPAYRTGHSKDSSSQRPHPHLFTECTDCSQAVGRQSVNQLSTESPLHDQHQMKHWGGGQANNTTKVKSLLNFRLSFRRAERLSKLKQQEQHKSAKGHVPGKSARLGKGNFTTALI